MTDTIIDEATDITELKQLLTDETDLHTQRMDVRKQIGVVLGKLRTSRKLSFRQAGQLLGCDPGLLNRVEKGNAWAYTIVEKALTKYSEPELQVDTPNEQ